MTTTLAAPPVPEAPTRPAPAPAPAPSTVPPPGAARRGADWDLAGLARLVGTPVLPATAATPAGPAIVVLEAWTPRLVDELSAGWRAAGATVLPVRCDGGTALIGPLQGPGSDVCLGCAEVERLSTIGGRTPRREPDLALGGGPTPAALPVLAALSTSALADPAAAVGLVWAVRTADLTLSVHRARPRRGGCEICGPLPDDDPAQVAFTPRSRPLPDPFRLRQDNPANTPARLREVLHDWRFGPVAHVSRSERLPLAIAHAEVVADWVERDGGYGRATTFAEAEQVALYEAAERLAGTRPRGKRTVVRGSYAELGPDRALDPALLGLHEPAAFDHPTFSLTPYTPDVPTSWVYGWSMARQRALAVPEQVAYWGHPPKPRADGMNEFVFESSNACGLGNSLEEAVLYALFEAAERDAFLMAWYARTPLRPVAIPTEDPFTAHLADRIDSLGYDLVLLDTTNDFSVPAVMAIVLSREPGAAGEGGGREGRSPAPYALFSAGAHHDPVAAIRSAVIEVTVNLVQSPNVAVAKPRYFDRQRLLRLLAEPDRVTTIDDHIALYTLPEARPIYEFLFTGQRPAPWREVWPDAPRPVADLGVLVADLCDTVVAAGMDVVVIDQSDPVVRAELGLHSARCVIPGAVPLTFASVFRRTRNLPRLLEVPHRLGRVPAPLVYDELPFDPHPFP